MTNPAPGWEKYPNHIVDIKPFDGTVSVHHQGVVLASSNQAVEVTESRHATAWYLPLTDVHAELSASDTKTYCPFKGYASYRNLTGESPPVDDVLWIYEDPYDECLALKGFASFYGDKVEITVEPAGSA